MELAIRTVTDEVSVSSSDRRGVQAERHPARYPEFLSFSILIGSSGGSSLSSRPSDRGHGVSVSSSDRRGVQAYLPFFI